MIVIKSNIRRLMAEERIDSIKELAKRAELSRPSVHKVYHEQNLENIPLRTLLSLCLVFDCTLDDLIVFTNEPNKKEPD